MADMAVYVQTSDQVLCMCRFVAEDSQLLLVKNNAGHSAVQFASAGQVRHPDISQSDANTECPIAAAALGLGMSRSLHALCIALPHPSCVLITLYTWLCAGAQVAEGPSGSAGAGRVAQAAS